jgi:iron complex outermembrane receptor protein
MGSRDIEAKELIAFELGYRIQPHDHVKIDVATFYNLYDKQRSLEPGAPTPAAPGYLVLPFTIDNLIDGETYGFEIAATWQATDWWKIQANYSFWRLSLHQKEGSADPFLEFAERDSPRHQVGIRSMMDLPHDIEFDTGLRYVDALPARMRFVNGSTSGGVPSYVVADARIAWHIIRDKKQDLELSLVGQNLFEAQHQEFAPSYIQTEVTQVETSVFAKITYRF